VGPALRILQLNVEGLSATKRSVINVIAGKQDIDIICLQETHVDKDKASLFSIPGFDLVSYVLHPKHGRAMHVLSNIADVAHVLPHLHRKWLSKRAEDEAVFLDLAAAYDTVWHTRLL